MNLFNKIIAAWQESKTKQKLSVEQGDNKQKASWYRDIVLIVLTVICTTLATQIVYEYNIKLQLQLEIEKDFILRQYHIYNRVKLLHEKFKIVTYKEYLPTQKLQRVYVKSDRFKNIHGRGFDVDSIVKYDSIQMTAPVFIFSDDVYDLFVENLSYIKSNIKDIEPEIYMSAKSLFDFLEKYPFPIKEKRIQEIFLSGWGREIVYTEFQEHLNKLYLNYQKCMDKYGIH